MVPPQFQVSAAVHLLQNRPPEDSFFSSRGRSPQAQSSRSARYSVESSSKNHVARQSSVQMQNGGMDAASVVVSTANAYRRSDGFSTMASGAMTQERSPSPAPRVPARMSSNFAPHSVRSPPQVARDSVRFSCPSFTPTQVTRQTTDGRGMPIVGKSARLASAVPPPNAAREASVLRSSPENFVATLPSFYSGQGQGLSVQLFKNVPTPLVQRGGSRILSPMMSSRIAYGGATPAVASTPRVPVQSHVSDLMPVGQFLSPRPGTSTPMPAPPLIHPGSNEWSLGPSVRNHNSNPIGGNAPRMPRQSRLTNSTPELLPPPRSPQVSDFMSLRSSASPAVQTLGGTHSPRPQGSPVWQSLPPPVRMTSGVQAVSDLQLSAGPRVDWNGFEERWYHGDFIEGKLRGWLATIPITGATDRAWDDTQIINLVQFAQDNRVEHLPAEEIYRQYVMHQVELADMG